MGKPSFGSNPEQRSSRAPLTKIKHEDYQVAVSAENRVPSQKEKGKVLGKVTINPFFVFWMVAFASLLPQHWFFPTVCYSISNRLPCSHVYIPLLPIPQFTASVSSKHMESKPYIMDILFQRESSARTFSFYAKWPRKVT